MSNQVYISQYQKYLPSVGVNFYLSSFTQLIATNTTITAIFGTDSIVSDPGNFSVNLDTGQITINVDGIYSIQGNIDLIDNVDPTNNDLDYGMSILYDSPGAGADFVTSLIRSRIPAKGGTTGNTEFSQSVNAVLYCKAGVILSIRVTNFAPTVLKIGNTQNSLLMQRVA